jgi:hypothetical protein
VDFKLVFQLRGELREAVQVFVEAGRFPALLSNDHFVVNQLQDGVGVLAEQRMLFQVGFHQSALAALPPRALFGPQLRDPLPHRETGADRIVGGRRLRILAFTHSLRGGTRFREGHHAPDGIFRAGSGLSDGAAPAG